MGTRPCRGPARSVPPPRPTTSRRRRGSGGRTAPAHRARRTIRSLPNRRRCRRARGRCRKRPGARRREGLRRGGWSGSVDDGRTGPVGYQDRAAAPTEDHVLAINAVAPGVALKELRPERLDAVRNLDLVARVPQRAQRVVQRLEHGEIGRGAGRPGVGREVEQNDPNLARSPRPAPERHEPGHAGGQGRRALAVRGHLALLRPFRRRGSAAAGSCRVSARGLTRPRAVGGSSARDAVASRCSAPHTGRARGAGVALRRSASGR